jgi:hypothetical protein
MLNALALGFLAKNGGGTGSAPDRSSISIAKTDCF